MINLAAVSFMEAATVPELNGMNHGKGISPKHCPVLSGLCLRAPLTGGSAASGTSNWPKPSPTGTRCTGSSIGKLGADLTTKVTSSIWLASRRWSAAREEVTQRWCGSTGTYWKCIWPRQTVALHKCSTLPGFPEGFTGFGGGAEERITDTAVQLVYKYRIGRTGSYFRGVQIIRPARNAQQLGELAYARDHGPKEYETFLNSGF